MKCPVVGCSKDVKRSTLGPDPIMLADLEAYKEQRAREGAAADEEEEDIIAPRKGAGAGAGTGAGSKRGRDE